MTFDPILPWWILALAAVGVLAVGVGRLARGGRVGEVVPGTLVAVLFVAMATDPATGGTAEARTSSADVLFLIDTTGSMSAEDYGGGQPRLDGVRADVMDLAEGFAGARFALVTFDSNALVEMPWTTDVGALQSMTDIVSTERTMYSRGSQLAAPIDTAREFLERSTESRDGRQLYLVYLSDGEQTEGDRGSFSSLAEGVAGSLVLGYGTPEGGRMRENYGYDLDDESYIYDYSTGEDAVSRIDESNLQAIADELGGEYHHRTEPGGLAEIAASLTADADTLGEGTRDGARRWYWVLAIAAAVAAAWQLAATTGAWIDSRRLAARPEGAR